jgi:hypothetical protein
MTRHFDSQVVLLFGPTHQPVHRNDISGRTRDDISSCTRTNKEINRRTRVVGIFPDEKSLIRLIGAELAEQNDEWAVSRKYMSRHSLARIYQSSTPEIEGDTVHAVSIPVH